MSRKHLTTILLFQGGLFLAEWCLANSSLFCGRHILELGSGCGVTGIAVAKCVSIKSYTFSDCHNDVIEQLEMNLKINRLTDGKINCILLSKVSRFITGSLILRIFIESNWG